MLYHLAFYNTISPLSNVCWFSAVRKVKLEMSKWKCFKTQASCNYCRGEGGWQVTPLMDGYSLYCLGNAPQHLHPSRSGPPPPLWFHRLQVCMMPPRSKSCCCTRGRRRCAWSEGKRARPGHSLPLSCQSDARTPAEPALELGTQASVKACL